jgi:hypothetical protein
LKLVVDMPAHSIAALERGRRRGLLWVAVAPRGHVIGFALMEITRGARLDRSALRARPLAGPGLRHGADRALRRDRPRAGHASLYLTTYRDVAWNKPFYARAASPMVARGVMDRTLRVEFLSGVRHATRSGGAR